MNRKIILTGLIFGFISIILGAFGAHALKKVLDANSLISFETGVRYMMYHALFLLFLGTYEKVNEATNKVVYYLVLCGVLFFSGSIFLLSTKSISGIDFKAIAIVTPIGGLLLILAWAILFFNIFKKRV